ncbi:MAG: hypothetical protein JXA09_05040 [Anaerolineae bacterium]|nr:hypothetical protein [Anaerolineae bacterium]
MELTSHCVKPGRWKLQGRAALGILLLMVAVSLLGWIFLTQASHVATTSVRVQELEDEIARIEQENWQLMAEIAELESVSRLAARAEELGFVMASAGQSEFLTMAAPPIAVAAAQASGSPAVVWWDNVTAQFTAWAQGGD